MRRTNHRQAFWTPRAGERPFAARHALTLVEVIVVVVILGLLLAVLIPGIQVSRESARRNACAENLRRVGEAFQMYVDYHGALPSGWIAYDTATGEPLPDGEPGWGWASMILAELTDGPPALSLVHFDESIRAEANSLARQHLITGYLCPSDRAERTFALDGVSLARANYVGVFGTRGVEACAGLPAGTRCEGDGVFYHLSATRPEELGDGRSLTMYVGERNSRLSEPTWLGALSQTEGAIPRVVGVAEHVPNSAQATAADFSSDHPGGANFLFGDGAVHFVADLIELSVYQKMARRSESPAEEEPLGEVSPIDAELSPSDGAASPRD